MKKLAFLLALVMISVAIVSCSSYSSENYLYSLGIEVAGTMKKLIRSDEYAEIYGIGDMEDIKSFAESLDLSGLDEPDDVYKVTLPEPEKLYESFFDGDDWDELDEVVRTQLENMMNAQSVISKINTQKSGTSAIVVASVYNTIVKDEKLSLEKPVTYLYVYESGTVIAVTFGEHGTAQGQFIFTDDPDEIDDEFEDFDCEVEKLKIK